MSDDPRENGLVNTHAFHRAAAGLLCLVVLASGLQASVKTPAPAFKNAFGTGSDKAEVMADQAEYELDSGWVTLAGNVAIRFRGMELRAEHIRYNNQTGDAQARERVVLVGSDGSVWQGEKLDLNLKQKAGEASGIDIFTTPFRVLAERGVITSDRQYIVDNAIVSTCTNAPGHFHYHLKARRLRIRPDDDITAWGVTPSLFGVPFFYMPWFWKDLSRHYGFRFEPGYQSTWGAFLLSSYKIPLYRNRDQNTYVDSRTSVDVRSKRGLALGERLSWRVGDDFEGWLSLYFLDDNDPPLTVTDTERYRIRLNQTWNITPRDQLLVQGLAVSDDRFMDNFFRTEHRRMNQPDNYVSYTRREDDFSFGLLTRFRLNDFYTQTERLPEGWFTLNAIELGESGLFVENRTSAGFLRRQFDERFDPFPESYHAFRFDTDTRLSMPMKKFGFLNIVPRAGYRATYYSQTLEPRLISRSERVVSTNEYGDVESFQQIRTSTENAEADADLRSIFELGTELSFKSFGLWQDRSGSIWRHEVEPYSDYTFIPEPNLVPAQLLAFDDIDTLDRRHNLRLGVRNRWQVKPEGGERTFERVYLNLYTDIDLDPQDDQKRVELISLDARYHPNTWLRFDMNTHYDVDNSQIDNAAVRLVAWHRAFSTDFEYRYRVDRSSLLLGNVTWRINNEWRVNTFGRYEFETTEVEEVGTWIERRYDCMAFRFYASVEPGYTNPIRGNEKDDYKFSILFWLTDFTPDRIREQDSR